MKKFYAVWFVVLFFLFSGINLQASPRFETKKTTFYKFFEPLFNKLGYKELKVQVFNSETLAPISDAIVMIGDKPEDTQNKNWMHTDADGLVAFEGFNLPQGALTVTVAHKDYSRFTLFQAMTNELKVYISPLADEPQDKALMSGEFTNWPHMEDHDGVLNAGFIIPFIDVISLVNFNTTKLLAPKVKARIYKEVEVPGNLVIPSQEERMWGFIPVYVNKPSYQMPFLKGSKQNLIALAGDLPFSKMAKGIMDKGPLTDLLNLFSMKQFSLVLDYQVPQTDTVMDVPLTYALKDRFNTHVNHSPKNKDIIFVSAGAFKENLSHVFPMDFKSASRNAKQKNASLKSIAAHNIFPPLQEMLMTLAADLPKNTGDKSKRDSALTGVLTRPAEKDRDIHITAFLNLIDVQAKDNSFTYKNRDDGSFDVNSQMAISFLTIESAKDAKTKKPDKTWWTVVSPSRQDKLTLPLLPEGLSDRPELVESRELHWAMNLFGFNSKDFIFDYNKLNDEMYSKGLTHFSRNSIKLD